MMQISVAKSQASGNLGSATQGTGDPNLTTPIASPVYLEILPSKEIGVPKS